MANGLAATESRHLWTLFAVGAAGILTDGQLLERFLTLRGDPAELAFAALVERHGPMVLRVARSTLVDEHSANDAFQATFLILARKARSLWVRDSLGPWLLAVARRVASEALSNEARRKDREIQAARPEAYDSEGRDREEIHRAIHQEIDRLPDPYRLAVETIHLDGLTQHEAAARLGWPVGTLQSRLARGRLRLRDRLERRGLAPSLLVVAGKGTPLPIALAASTVRAAATLQLGKTAAEIFSPTVLALIETTSKGMLMTKLKLGVLALMATLGFVASGTVLGLGQTARAIDDLASARVSTPERPTGGADESDKTTASDDSIPPPAKGPSQFTLLEFYETQSVVGLKQHEEFAKLKERGYPIESADVAIRGNGFSPGLALAHQYGVNAYPATILVADGGIEVARLMGLKTPAEVAAFYNQHKRKLKTSGEVVESVNLSRPGGKVSAPRPDDEVPSRRVDLPAESRASQPPEPALETLPPPRPWETVVRITVKHTDQEWGVCSGTVIRSTDQDTIVLTCAHEFRIPGGAPQPSPAEFRVPIRVDLFDGKFTSRNPARLGRAESDLPGELIDQDVVHDLALVRIRPGRVIPASRVVSSNKPPVRGMRMYSLGCTNGDDPTAWDTVILDPSVALSHASTRSPYAAAGAIKCAYLPGEGREGGGLYTTEGVLMGICQFGDPKEQVGLYARPEFIRNLLDRNGLAAVHGQDVVRIAPPQAKAFRPDPILGSARVYQDSTTSKAKAGPTAQPPASRPGSDQAQRLDELERKLDQVLKALEALKGDATSGQLKPGLRP